MATTIQIRGTEDFARAAALMRAAPPHLRRELSRALNSTTKDSRAEVVKGLPAYLPNNYAGELGGDLSVRTFGGVSLRVIIRARGRRKRRMVGALERGLLRHPLFGNRAHWFSQAVRPGFFTEPLHRDAPETARALVRGIEAVANRVAAGS